jgi:hypothetical protein
MSATPTTKDLRGGAITHVLPGIILCSSDMPDILTQPKLRASVVVSDHDSFV